MERQSRNLLITSSPPYIKNGETVHCLMFDVIIALVPVALFSIYVFGVRSLWIIFISSMTAVITEGVLQLLLFTKEFNYKTPILSFIKSEDITVTDGSALVTGLLLAFTLPPTVPYWIPIVGTVVAIALGKLAFGGLGYNIFNPALLGRAFLLAAWPVYMTTWLAPINADVVTTATPLSMMKEDGQLTPIINLIVGNVSGSIGETSVVALLLGAAYLFYKRTITWHIPVSYIGTVFVFSLVLGMPAFFHVFSGGLILGAFYMATDVVTSPCTPKGRIIFGCGAGIITILIRKYGGYPEGVCYAILIMNAVAPLIDRIKR
ncbi:MAG: RnfABCDGE type electron transport complex subunit D [Candidatus Magnetoovum sp. WYHC-5]|nr:RnfABCDGE type electron transport complex subunit D [Candidatus Magnetoovum sp. WYHC-5]